MTRAATEQQRAPRIFVAQYNFASRGTLDVLVTKITAAGPRPRPRRPFDLSKRQFTVVATRILPVGLALCGAPVQRCRPSSLRLFQ
jgi:hypothetical protein